MKEYSELRSEIMERLHNDLKDKRLLHTLGVESTAIALARRYGVDEQEASVAALLHDCAKYMPVEEQLKWIRQGEIGTRFPDIDQYPKLLHAFSAAELCAVEYPQLSDQVIDAIRYHTTGRSHMGTLEKIIFSADYIEPGRVQFSGLQEARERTFADLDAGVALILKQTIAYLEQQDQPCFALTQEAYEFYKDQIPEESTIILENVLEL
ncbi:MAG: bis(5'-nucleosyl)-tetraphosphatase (symmetrical) YqeK [Clostridiales bacterium]|nr:bis(5'-nucleosyl)-tetraphosphatase (symmetrical) YqeK [Clostridiales bacterium]